MPYSISIPSSVITGTSATPTNVGTGDFTIACWANRNNGRDAADSIFNNFTGTTGIYWQFEIDTLRAYFGNITSRLTVSGVGYAAQSVWKRYVLQRSGNTVNMFINGVLAGTATGVSADNCSGRIAVWGDTNPFNGKLCRPAVWNRALTAAEVLADYMGTHSATDHANGLVTEYLMTEGTGTTASLVDASGQGNTGGVTTTAAWVLDSPSISRPASRNLPYSVGITSSTGRMEVANAASLNSTTAMTARIWLNIPPSLRATAAANAFSKTTSGSWNDGWGITLTSTYGVMAWINSYNTAGQRVTYGFDRNITGWHCFVLTYDKVAVKLYVDGRLVGSTAYTGDIVPSSGVLTIGADPGGGEHFANGKWSEAMYFNTAWSATDVYNDYFLNTQPTSGRVSKWGFTEGTGTSIADSYGANTGTLSGTAAWLSDSPMKSRLVNRNIPYSLNFAGTNQYGKATAVPFANATQVTILAWVKLLPTANNTSILESYINVTADNALSIYQNRTNTAATPLALGIYMNDLTNTRVSSAQTDELPPNQWLRICAVYDQSVSSNQCTIYVNGTNSVLTRANNGNCIAGIKTNDLYFGMRAGSIIPFKGGLIVNSITTGKAFTAAEALSEYQTGVMPSGGTPLANYAWDEGSGATIADTGTGAKNIALTNSPLWSQDTPRKPRYKLSNKTASLKLAQASSQKGTTAVGVNMSSATQLTVEAWFKINAVTGTAQVLVGNTDATAANNGWEIEYDNAAVLAKTFLFLICRGASINYTRSSVLPIGVWHKVVCVYDGSLAAASRAKVYVNGYLDSTNARADAVTGGFDSDILTLGDRRTAGFYPNSQNGMLRIYPGVAATPAQVFDNYYNDTLFGTPVARYEFNDGSGTSVADSSGNGYNITLVNTPTWSSTDMPMKPRTQIT